MQQAINRDRTNLLTGVANMKVLGVPRKETPSYSTSFPAVTRPWERGHFLLALRTYAWTFKRNSCFTSSQGSNFPYIWPSKQLTGVVVNQLSVVKPKRKLSLAPFAKGTDNQLKGNKPIKTRSQYTQSAGKRVCPCCDWFWFDF